MKLHIIGLAGSGKTTLATWAGATFGVPAFDLDPVVFSEAGERPREELLARLRKIMAQAGWVTEGAYHDEWVHELLGDADVIVWLDVPLWICVPRMIKRHVLAELRGANKHPGWRKLRRFLDYTRRTAAEQQKATATLLQPHARKVRRCRSSADVQRLKNRLIGTRAA